MKHLINLTTKVNLLTIICFILLFASCRKSESDTDTNNTLVPGHLPQRIHFKSSAAIDDYVYEYVNGNEISVFHKGRVPYTITYDAAKHPVKMEGDHAVLLFTVNTAGQITRSDYSNAQTGEKEYMLFTYDSKNHLTWFKKYTPAGIFTSEIKLEYDAAGNMTKYEDHAGSDDEIALLTSDSANGMYKNIAYPEIFIEIEPVFSAVNNFTSASFPNSPNAGYSITYTYDKDNYPITETYKNNGGSNDQTATIAYLNQ